MNLAYPLFNEPLSFDEDRINVVVIENQKELRKAVVTLQQQIVSGVGDFVLSEQFKPVELSRYASFVTNPFDIVLESKKISAKLNRAACDVGENYTDEFYKIAADINVLASKIGASMDFDVSFAPLEDLESLIELLKFHIDKEELDFPEQILAHMRLYRNFFGTRLFAFYNLKACMSAEELSLLYRSIRYEKFHVLLIEDVQRGEVITDEKVVIIDKDLCIF
jgi:CRISPR type II-A-associated protein Csn2